MKKQAKAQYLIILDYIVTFYVYIIPPMLVARNLSLIPSVAYSAETVLSALIMGVFYFFLIHYTGNTAEINPYSATTHTHKTLTTREKILFGTGILLVLFVFQFIASLAAQAFENEIAIHIPPPSEISAWLLFIAGTCVLACFEEIVYRVYLPSRTADIFNLLINRSDNPSKRLVTAMPEVISILCFALAHRYAGWFAVLNALCAGALLRLTVKKTGAVWCACVIHSVYNCVLFIILMYA